MEELVIDPEFKSLIPPLQSDEYDNLEASIKIEGCRDAIIKWGQVIVDGHNRFEICQKHKLPFSTRTHGFENREQAKHWIITNQLSRRNLQPIDKIALATKLEEMERAAAKERMSEGGQVGTAIQGKRGKENFTDPSHKGQTRDRLGELAGVSGPTYQRGKKILNSGTPELVQAVREKKVSISAAAKIADMPKEKQNDAINQDSPNPSLTPEFAPQSLGKGVRLAHEAIAILKRIPSDDKLRLEGFDIVMRWIKHNR